jgi:probable phosphoglycerate mutase
MTARRIVLWRHGRTAWNAEHRFQGQLDVPLDEVGLAQAERAAALLTGLRPSAVVCSDLQRARSTAAPLLELTGLSASYDPGLRETFAGEWQGLTRRELEERYGADLARWAAGADMRPGGGETRVEVSERMVAAITAALDPLPADATLVVVSHGGAVRAAIGRLLGLPPQHWAALGVLSNCAWSVLLENTQPVGPPWRLLEYNAGSLPEPALGDDR